MCEIERNAWAWFIQWAFFCRAEGYALRNRLAGLDYNHHVDFNYALGKNEEVRSVETIFEKQFIWYFIILLIILSAIMD